MARSDFARGNTAGPVSPSSMGSASPLVLLRARQFFHGVERNFRISVLVQRRWWYDKWFNRKLARHVYRAGSVDAQQFLSNPLKTRARSRRNKRQIIFVLDPYCDTQILHRISQYLRMNVPANDCTCE